VQSALSQGFTALEANEQPPAVHFAQINEMDGFFITGRGPEPGFEWNRLVGKQVLVDHGGQPLAMFRYACHQMNVAYDTIEAIDAGDTKEGSYVLRNIESLCMAISEKEREASNIEIEFMARKYARWAQTQLTKEFKAKITATEPELKGELKDNIIGAKLQLTAHDHCTLFEDVIVRIDKVDIAKAKIFATIVRRVDV